MVTVLIAEDHRMFRQAIERALARSEGIEVVGVVEDGEAGLEAIRRLAPDVALLDVNMPGRGGREVLGAVAQEGLGSRVLFLTGSLEQEETYDLLAAGATGILLKVIGPDEIEEAVFEVARGRPVLAEALRPGLAAEVRRRGEDGLPPGLGPFTG